MRSIKPEPVYRIEMIQPLNVSGYLLRIGQTFRTELIGRGTNWIKVKLPNGPVKTLFNFEAKWTLAD